MESQTTSPTRRSRKLIDRPLQLRLVGTFLAVGCVAILFQVILMNQAVLQLGRSLGDPGEQVLRQGPGMLLRTQLITMAVMIPVSLTIGILVTHRIAGPAYRMRMYLEDIAENGVPEHACKVRDGDELQDLCEQLNKAVSALQVGPSAKGDATSGSDEPLPPLPQVATSTESAAS